MGRFLRSRRGSGIRLAASLALLLAAICGAGCDRREVDSGRGEPLSARELWASQNAPQPLDADQIRAAESEIETLRSFVDAASPETLLEGMEKGGALARLASLLVSLGRHEEARRVFLQLIEGQAGSAPMGRHYRRMYGESALFVGRSHEALRAFIDAGDHNRKETYYFMGLLLEEEGQIDEAMEAYRSAIRRDSGYAEPVLRSALLILEKKGDPSGAIDFLVQQSRGVGRDALIGKLNEGSSLAPLREALRQSGREEELEQQQARQVEWRDLPPPKLGERAPVTFLDLKQVEATGALDGEDWRSEDVTERLRRAGSEAEGEKGASAEAEGPHYVPLFAPNTARLPEDPLADDPLRGQPNPALLREVKIKTWLSLRDHLEAIQRDRGGAEVPAHDREKWDAYLAQESVRLAELDRWVEENEVTPTEIGKARAVIAKLRSRRPR